MVGEFASTSRAALPAPRAQCGPGDCTRRALTCYAACCALNLLTARV